MDITLSRANAGELSSWLAGDARTWLTLLRQQRGHWDDLRQMQIDQAITGLEIIVNEHREIASASDWMALELGHVEIVEEREGETDIAITVVNPNDMDAPISPLFIAVLLGGIMYWPRVSRIAAQTRVTLVITVDAALKPGQFEVRFPGSHEM